MSDRWIWIPKWDGREGFQHYKDRNPAWIKNYVELLSRDDYLELTLNQRAVLHGLWLSFAAGRREVAGSTAAVSRRLNGRVTEATLQALNRAGFIEFVDSKELARRKHFASPEQKQRREEEDTDREARPDADIELSLPVVGSINHEAALERLLAVLDDVDANTPAVLTDAADGLTAEQIDAVRVDAMHSSVRTTRTRYVIACLRRTRRVVAA